MLRPYLQEFVHLPVCKRPKAEQKQHFPRIIFSRFSMHFPPETANKIVFLRSKNAGKPSGFSYFPRVSFPFSHNLHSFFRKSTLTTRHLSIDSEEKKQDVGDFAVGDIGKTAHRLVAQLHRISWGCAAFEDVLEMWVSYEPCKCCAKAAEVHRERHKSYWN